MGDLQVASAGRVQCTADSSSVLPQLTASATPHVKGNWTVLLDPTAEPLCAMWLTMGAGVSSAGTDSSMLLDIGIAPTGAGAGTETVLVPNVMLGGHVGWPAILLPVQVPAGYRISARIQAAVASKTARVGVTTIPGGGAISPIEGCQHCTDLGTTTASSKGTDLTVPSGTNVEGAWTALSASTPHLARWLTLMMAMPNTATATDSGNDVIDLAVGAAAAEQIILENQPWNVNVSEQTKSAYITVPVNIPAGSRLSARYKSDTSVVTAARPQVAALIFG